MLQNPDINNKFAESIVPDFTFNRKRFLLLTKLKYLLLGVFIFSVLERGGMLVTHFVANYIDKIEQQEALPENTDKSKTELSVKEYFHSTFVMLFGAGQTPVATKFVEADTCFLLDFHPPVPTPPPDLAG